MQEVVIEKSKEFVKENLTLGKIKLDGPWKAYRARIGALNVAVGIKRSFTLMAKKLSSGAPADDKVDRPTELVFASNRHIIVEDSPHYLEAEED